MMPARMTLVEYRTAAEHAAKKPRRNKYGNVPTIGVDGKRKASKTEAKRDAELALLERVGTIRNLVRQPRFPLVVNGALICTYVGDWQYDKSAPYTTPSGREIWVRQPVVEDRKGVQTPAFKIKWALAKALYPDIEWRLS